MNFYYWCRMIVPNGAVATGLVRRGGKLARLLLDGRFRAACATAWPRPSSTRRRWPGATARAWSTSAPTAASSPCSAPGLYPKAQIFAFEPLPGPYAILARIAARHPRIRAHQAAIGPSAGPAQMHVIRPDDCSSLLAPTARQSPIFRGSSHSGVATAALAPLDVIVTARELALPSLLKLDVQGFQLEALKGCAGRLDRAPRSTSSARSSACTPIRPWRTRFSRTWPSAASR
jgi:FkbM family methyltransferase